MHLPKTRYIVMIILIVSIIGVHIGPVSQAIQRNMLINQENHTTQALPKRLTHEQSVYLLLTHGETQQAATYLTETPQSALSLYNLGTTYIQESQHPGTPSDRLLLYEAERLLSQAQQQNQQPDLQEAIDHNLSVIRQLLQDAGSSHEEQSAAQPTDGTPGGGQGSDQQEHSREHTQEMTAPLSPEEHEQISAYQEQISQDQQAYLRYFNKQISERNNPFATTDTQPHSPGKNR